MPKSKLDFWVPKLKGNRLRDERVKIALEQQGWRVFEVWECKTRPEDLRKLVTKIKMVRPVKQDQRRAYKARKAAGRTKRN